MPDTIKLSDLPAGSRAVVKAFPTTGPAFVRLREMGLLPGTSITFLRAAPLGDPIEIKVRGYNLTLRKGEAAQVLVELAS